MAATESPPLLPVRLIAAVTDEPSHLLLRDEQGRSMTVSVDPGQAHWAYWRLRGKSLSPPTACELLHSLFQQQGARIVEARLSGVGGCGRVGTVVLDGGPGTLLCAPGDAIALSLVAQAPLYATEPIVAESCSKLADGSPLAAADVDARLSQRDALNKLHDELPAGVTTTFDSPDRDNSLSLPLATRMPVWLTTQVPRRDGEMDVDHWRSVSTIVEGQVKLGDRDASLWVNGQPGGVSIGADVVAAWELVEGETIVATAHAERDGSWRLVPTHGGTERTRRETMRHVQDLLDEATGLEVLRLRPGGTCLAIDYRARGKRTLGALPASHWPALLSGFCVRAGLPALPDEAGSGVVEVPLPGERMVRLRITVEPHGSDWWVVVRPLRRWPVRRMRAGRRERGGGRG